MDIDENNKTFEGKKYVLQLLCPFCVDSDFPRVLVS